jgi:hypothetical protein
LSTAHSLYNIHVQTFNLRYLVEAEQKLERLILVGLGGAVSLVDIYTQSRAEQRADSGERESTELLTGIVRGKGDGPKKVKGRAAFSERLSMGGPGSVAAAAAVRRRR